MCRVQSLNDNSKSKRIVDMGTSNEQRWSSGEYFSFWVKYSFKNNSKLLVGGHLDIKFSEFFKQMVILDIADPEASLRCLTSSIISPF